MSLHNNTYAIEIIMLKMHDECIYIFHQINSYITNLNITNLINEIRVFLFSTANTCMLILFAERVYVKT